MDQHRRLYEIRARDVGWGIPDRDWGDGPLDAGLGEVLEDVGTKTLRYLYDFGDGWGAHNQSRTPHRSRTWRTLSATNRGERTFCPPEDIGGPWGYAEFREAIGNPKPARHAEFKEWFADDFDPNLVDAGWFAEEVTTLAKRWSRKPAVRRPRHA